MECGADAWMLRARQRDAEVVRIYLDWVRWEAAASPADGLEAGGPESGHFDHFLFPVILTVEAPPPSSQLAFLPAVQQHLSWRRSCYSFSRWAKHTHWLCLDSGSATFEGPRLWRSYLSVFAKLDGLAFGTFPGCNNTLLLTNPVISFISFVHLLNLLQGAKGSAGICPRNH